jgi:hypothetical protein
LLTLAACPPSKTDRSETICGQRDVAEIHDTAIVLQRTPLPLHHCTVSRELGDGEHGGTRDGRRDRLIMLITHHSSSIEECKNGVLIDCYYVIVIHF